MTNGNKRTVNHEALRLALEHERTCFNDCVREWYVKQKAGEQSSHGYYNEYVTLKEKHPELYDRVIERWVEAREFERWLIAEFKRAYGSEVPS